MVYFCLETFFIKWNMKRSFINIQAGVISQNWKSCLPNEWVISNLYSHDAFHTRIGKQRNANFQHCWSQSHKIYTFFHSHLLGCSTKLPNNVPVMLYCTLFSGLLKLFPYVGKSLVDDYANLIRMLLNHLNLIGILLIWR